jgi:hypothetical protein
MFVSATAMARSVAGQANGINGPVSPALLRRALTALDRHHESIAYRDFIGIADFSSHLVAHGRAPGSNASSAGAYTTGVAYVGAHGHSIRLEGLDPSNDNALSRAIIVHSVWYVSDEMIGHFGMPGRSEGCFAVAGSSLPEVMMKLGPGRLLYADNVNAMS